MRRRKVALPRTQPKSSVTNTYLTPANITELFIIAFRRLASMQLASQVLAEKMFDGDHDIDEKRIN